MPTMAVDAAPAQLGAAVLNPERLVAVAALGGRLLDRLMRVMAVCAGDVLVHREPGVRRRVEWAVTAYAIPRAVGVAIELEGMAGVAFRPLALFVDVWVRRLLVVACRARSDVDLLEVRPVRVVAIVAVESQVEHVLRVAGREAIGVPGRGDLALRAVLPLLHHRRHDVMRELHEEEPSDKTQHCEEPDDDQRPLHRPPMGQSLQGRSLALLRRLLKPGGCGLPPGPPTK